MSAPPMPWAKWDDGEPVGWDVAWSLWKSFLLPYRTAEYLGYDEATLEMRLGPWKWNRPDVLRASPKERATEDGSSSAGGCGGVQDG